MVSAGEMLTKQSKPFVLLGGLLGLGGRIILFEAREILGVPR